jgi:hypothetical protein
MSHSIIDEYSLPSASSVAQIMTLDCIINHETKNDLLELS